MPDLDIGGDVSKAIEATLNFFEKKKRKKDIDAFVSKARERGDKITLSVDPQTGAITPKIETLAPSPFAGLLGEGGGFGGGRLKSISTKGVGTIDFPKREAQRKAAGQRAEFIQTAETILTQPEQMDQLAQGGLVTLSRGEVKQKFDISKPEGIERALQFKFGADFRIQEDTQHLGVLLDEMKAQREQKATETKKAKGEKKVQPFAETVLGRIGKKGAAFKEAVTKYGEETTKSIVSKIVAAQKKNVPISKIEADLRAKGFDPDLFLKDVRK